MDPLLGEVKFVGFNFAPVGYLPCDGRLLQISQNSALFSLLGTTFGGDGIQTFGIPKIPENPGPHEKGLSIIAIQGIYASRG